MEVRKIRDSLGQSPRCKTNSQSQGFAVVSMLALLPLVLTVFVSVAAAFYIMKRKILAQSICVQQASRMQKSLGDSLQKLLRLNPRATVLRAKRQAADASLNSATATGYPPAIAAAKAQQLAVILEQHVLRARQLALLADAARTRVQGQRDLRQKVSTLNAFQIHSQAFYFRPLAVEPKPRFNLTPNYEPVSQFTTRQQHRFDYRVDLLGMFAGHLDFALDSVQKINCAVSLEERGDDWNLRILAAKAP